MCQDAAAPAPTAPLSTSRSCFRWGRILSSGRLCDIVLTDTCSLEKAKPSKCYVGGLRYMLPVCKAQYGRFNNTIWSWAVLLIGICEMRSSIQPGLPTVHSYHIRSSLYPCLFISLLKILYLYYKKHKAHINLLPILGAQFPNTGNARCVEHRNTKG